MNDGLSPRGSARLYYVHMQSSKLYAGGAALILAAIALSGCSKNNNTTPPTVQVANISGDYCVPSAGCPATWQDAQYGAATAVSARLAQHGSSAGGAMTGTFGSTGLTAQLVLSVTTANAVSGTIVVDFPNQGVFANQTCTFSTTGTYTNNNGNASLTGSYTAVTGCSGDSGTYALTQSCTDTVTVAGPRRPMTLPPKC